MPAPCKMSDFWPRIWIEDEVLFRTHLRGEHQSPIVDEIGPHADEIRWGLTFPCRIASKPICGLVDSHDKVARMQARQMPRRQADAAAGIEDQRLAPRCPPRRHAHVERCPVIWHDRLAELGSGMPRDQCRQLLMDARLGTGDRTRIRVHIRPIPRCDRPRSQNRRRRAPWATDGGYVDRPRRCHGDAAGNPAGLGRGCRARYRHAR